MTLRTRVTLAAGVAVLLAVVAVSAAVYVIMRGDLYGQIDESLSHYRPASGSVGQHAVPPDASALPRDLPLAHQVFRQVVDRDGKIVTMVGDRPLPVTAEVAPVHRVAEAADTVARTGDLSQHLAVPGGDDLGRLAASFNTMLDALSESLTRQRRLVADASHELRTPLATVRTNVEVLARAEELAPEDRASLIADTVVQIGELT